MTTFVNLSYTTSHPGVTRFERAYTSAKAVIQRLQQESTYAAALLMCGAFELASLLSTISPMPHQKAKNWALGSFCGQQFWWAWWALANTANANSVLGSKPSAKTACGTAP